MANTMRDFRAASLFIDDCPDGTLYCYQPSPNHDLIGPA
jgi:hypothetical protein